MLFSLCSVTEIVRRNKEKDLFENQTCNLMIQVVKASMAEVLPGGWVVQLPLTP